jgi:DNA-binding response OmpR family regulator
MTADRHETILVVEDDEHLRRLLTLALRLEGFHTHEASDGLEAILILDRTSVDAVVLDIMLPGIDGIAVRREIAAHSPTLPVIIVTGSTVSADHVGTTYLLRKPTTPEQVVTAVKQCLQERRT